MSMMKAANCCLLMLQFVINRLIGLASEQHQF